MAKNSTPKLQDNLLLNRYFCSLFDFPTIEEAFRILKSNRSVDNIGEFLHFSELIAPHVIDHHLLENLQMYDQNIQEYLFRINKSRNPKIRLKYFQYLAVLFTEIYLHRYFSEKFIFCKELENFFKHEKISFTPRFNKLAYWAATGSGKTIIMHINMLQWEKYSFFSKSYNNIVLITPNQGLTLQHTLELTQSSIVSSYIGGMQHKHYIPLAKNMRVKITEITKIKEHVKNLDGKSLPLEWFGQPNVVFIDEGHKGHASETRVWKSLQSRLAGENGFTFEYSATFGEIVQDPEVFWEYATSIIFDYRYRFFYTDGFGKDFEIFNLSNQDEYDEIYLTTALLSFYQQKIYYLFHPMIKNQFHISDPLMIFVGSKVTGRKNRSDILLVIKFLNRFTSYVGQFSKIINSLLQEGKEKRGDYQQNVFHNHFLYLKKLIRNKTLKLGNIHGHILDILFHSLTPGKCRLTELDSADGEIGLSLGDSFFGVINIGDTSSFLKLVQTHLNSEVIINPKSNFEDSLFFDLDNPQSHLNFLIGSKKFIEGWNSYRVSTMVLLNIGKREGPQIIQLFGRGVRLYGYGNSLLRSSALKESTLSNLFGELPPIPKYMPLVETLNIFGLNADYMATFQSVLNKEFENSIPLRDIYKGINAKTLISSGKPSNLGMKVNKKSKRASLSPIKLKTIQENELKQILETQDEICINFSSLIHTSSAHIHNHSEVPSSLPKNAMKIDLNLPLMDFQEIYLRLINFCVRRNITSFYFTPLGLEKWISEIKFSFLGNLYSKVSLSENSAQILSYMDKYTVLIYQNLFVRLHQSYPTSFFLFVP